MDDHDDTQKNILEIFEEKEPRLKLYARWRIGQHRWGNRGSSILPGGIDVDDIVYSALCHLMTNLKPYLIENRQENLSIKDEIYRRFKRRIDTIISNISRSEENKTTFYVSSIKKEKYSDNVVDIYDILYKNLRNSPEDEYIVKDFIRYVYLETEEKNSLRYNIYLVGERNILSERSGKAFRFAYFNCL